MNEIVGDSSPLNFKTRIGTSLSSKVVSLLLILFGVFASVNYYVQRHVVYPSFEALEHEDVHKNVNRAILAIQGELDALRPLTADWANWDDSYEFMVDHNQAYIDANLYASAVGIIGVNMMMFYNIEGELVWGMGLNLDNKTVLDSELFLPATLPAQHALLSEASSIEPIQGIINTPAGPVMFISHPVLTDDGEGPARGNIIFGNLLNAKAIARIASKSRINLQAQAPKVNNGDKSAIVKATDRGLRRMQVKLREQGSLLIGATTLIDIQGNPAIDIKVTVPRTITARGDKAMLIANVSTALAALITLFVILVFLRKTVFAPVTQLTEYAIKVGHGNDLSDQLALNRSDEIGVLADEFDLMVTRLAGSSQRVSELSYQAGIAEMASGVLHNIGNAITPLGIKLTMIKQNIQNAPLAEMEIARTELADQTTSADRRSDLLAFMELASEELSALIERMPQEMDTMRTHVDHVQSVLADQQRFSRAERLLEPLSIYTLLQDTLLLLPEPLQAFTRVDIDSALSLADKVLVGRIALQQVINNLLINSAESIRESGKKVDTGLIRVFVAEGLDGDDEYLHLCFADNGAGIESQNINLLFESGFSTKLRGSGVGLHWCANTISGMGGRMYAESDGPGQGACMNLLLPRVKSNEQDLGNVV